jgi:hypothetical protein
LNYQVAQKEDTKKKDDEKRKADDKRKDDERQAKNEADRYDKDSMDRFQTNRERRNQRFCLGSISPYKKLALPLPSFEKGFKKELRTNILQEKAGRREAQE